MSDDPQRDPAPVVPVPRGEDGAGEARSADDDGTADREGGPFIKVFMHEVHERVFEIDLTKLCDDYMWPITVDDSEITEIMEHSDTWHERELPKWMVEKPEESNGWREVSEIQRPG